MRNNGVSLFAQDDWRAGARLTLNLGMRYDYDSKFGDANNIAPRLGVVWAPDERTAIRANWGIFYDRYRLGLAQAVPELGGFNGQDGRGDGLSAPGRRRAEPPGSLGRLAARRRRSTRPAQALRHSRRTRS